MENLNNLVEIENSVEVSKYVEVSNVSCWLNKNDKDIYVNGILEYKNPKKNTVTKVKVCIMDEEGRVNYSFGENMPPVCVPSKDGFSISAFWLERKFDVNTIVKIKVFAVLYDKEEKKSEEED